MSRSTARRQHHAGKNTASLFSGDDPERGELLLRYSLGLKREANAVERAVQRAAHGGLSHEGHCRAGQGQHDERGRRGSGELHPRRGGRFPLRRL